MPTISYWRTKNAAFRKTVVDLAHPSNPPVVTNTSVDWGIDVIGVIKPAYRRKPPGYVAPTTYQKYGRNDCGSGCPGFLTGTRADLLTTITGPDTTFKSGLGWPGFDPVLENKALLKARSRMKNQNVNMTLAFAEAKQTAGLVATTAKRVTKAISAVRRGDIKGIVSALGITKPRVLSRKARKAAKRLRKGTGSESDAHNLWLSHKYGWLPLLSDVHGLAKRQADLDTANPNRYMFNVKASVTVKRNFDLAARKDQLAFATAPAIRYRKQNDVEHALVRIDFRKGIPNLAQAAADGFTNPLDLAWEKIPFSFVADWFVPIGSYLNQLDATVGWEFVSGSLSQYIKQKESIWQTVDLERATSDGWSGLNLGGSHTSYSWNFIRSIYGAMPIPSFVASILPKNPFTAGHATTAIALLLQKFGK